MAWLYLFIAGLCEVGWVIGLKYSHGFSRPLPSVLTAISMIVSLYLLALAVKHLPLGQSYAIWTGIGIIGNAIIGTYLFKESLSYFQIGAILLILIGIIGLKLSN